MNTKTTNTARFFAIFALAATLGAGAQAADVARVQVKYDDLNINSKAGAAVLYQRIRGAAIEVCGDSGDRDLTRAFQIKACVDRAVAEAVTKVNATSVRVASN